MRPQQHIYKSAITDGTHWAAYNHRPGDIFVCTPPKRSTRSCFAPFSISMNSAVVVVFAVRTLSEWNFVQQDDDLQ